MAPPPGNPARTDAILERLKALHPKAIDLSLDRMQRLLERLGHPQRRLPPVIHVAGTNGKGSVVAYLRAFFEAAGYSAHVYTSPHLVRFRERIRVAGRLIDEEVLSRYLERCEQANGDAPITFFEITTAAALLAFAEQAADIVLLETGLGGRLDATNVVERPLLTAITPVAFDHMQYLGNTIAEIAGEKAGIIKPGISCVLAPQTDEAARAIGARAGALSAPLFRGGIDWRAGREGEHLVWSGEGARLVLPLPALPGLHQIGNAGTAIACTRRLPAFGFDQAALARGLGAVEWPARLQRLTRGPLPSLVPAGTELWLDGGHNPAAGEALAATLADWRANDPRPLLMVVGMLNTKDPTGFLAPLAPLVVRAMAVAIPGEPNSFSAAEIAQVAARAGIACEAAPDVATALEMLCAGPAPRSADGPPPRVLITGSLYLAGTILAGNG